MTRINNYRARTAIAGVVAVATLGLYAGAAEAIQRRLYVHLTVPNPACNSSDPNGAVVAFGELLVGSFNVNVTTLGSTASTGVAGGADPASYFTGLTRINPQTQTWNSLGNSLCLQARSFPHGANCSAVIPAHGNCAAQTMRVDTFTASSQ